VRGTIPASLEGYPVSRLEHSLQAATRALRDQADEDQERCDEDGGGEDADDDHLMRLDRHGIALHRGTFADAEKAPEHGTGDFQQRGRSCCRRSRIGRWFRRCHPRKCSISGAFWPASA